MPTPSSSQNSPWSLVGKTAIVTGGSRGIGQAIALHLSRKGVTNIAITYASNLEGAEATLRECRSLGAEKTAAIKADALDPDFAVKVISEALANLQTTTIDILVNNAILNDPSTAVPVKDMSLATFLSLMQGNVYAPVSLTTAVLPHLPPYGGRVINISSILAMEGTSDPTIAYGAQKAALQSYTRSFASSFAKSTGATFNSVVVGPTATDAVKASLDVMPAGYIDKKIEETTAADRIGTPDDIAYVVGFLSSEEARWVNGAAVSANGGNKLIMAALG